MPESSPLRIRLEKLTKTFGQLKANSDINLEIEPGRVVALLGENGAGKSTLVSMLSGHLQPSSGTIYLNDIAVELSSTEKALEHGIGMVYQQCKLVEAMTVAENIFLGRRGGFWLSRRRMEKQVQKLANLFDIQVDPAARVSELSMAEKQQVEILKLLHRNSRFLIFDEPTTLLTAAETKSFFNVIRMVADAGKTVILISHKLEEVLAIADSIILLHQGRVVEHLPAATFSSAAELAERMLGESPLKPLGREAIEPRQIILKICGLSGKRLNSIDLELRQGEILALLGAAGNGQRALVRAICGIQQPPVGTVTLFGLEWARFFAQRPWDRGLSYIPEDRHGLAACKDLDLLDNFLLTTQEGFVSGPWLDKEKAREKAAHLLAEFGVQVPDLTMEAGQLSGGNLQKMIIAREFFRRPRLIVAEYPTQGLDINAAEDIRTLLLKAREQAGILLVTGDLAEAVTMADRIGVMYRGCLIDCFPSDDLDKVAAIPAMMAGAYSLADDGLPAA